MTVVTKEITVNAPPQTVWRYFESGDLLAAWLMRNNFTGKVGEDFQFFGNSCNEDWDGVLHCKLITFEAPKKIAFTWDANNIGGETLVTIDLIPEGGATRIRLVHANFENASRDIAAIVERHNAGWSKFITILENQIADDARRDARQSPAPMDWTRFDLYVAIDAAPNEVLQMWSTMEGMEAFFVELMRITGPDGQEIGRTHAASAGNAYVWRWYNGNALKGHYLEAEQDNEVRFTFGESKVSVTAHAHGTGTLLQLTQYDLPGPEDMRIHIHVNCRGWWIYFLTILKTVMEHGVDGRDRNRETASGFSTYFDTSPLGLDASPSQSHMARG